jgi:lipopolysaccharide transport system permease protein
MQALIADVREMLHEQVQYRELLYQMTRRDLMLRYKQTVMGFGWAIFTPLVNTVIFSVVFTRVAPLDVGVPYPVYAYCGLWVWNFFAATLRFSVTSLTSNSNLISKVYFPREIFPFSTVIVAAVDFVVGASLLVGLMAYYRVPASWAMLFLPVVIVVQLIFTAGIALFLAMGNLFYRDVKYLFEVVITLWMFATSVLYPMDRVGGVLGTMLKANPMTPLIDAYRGFLVVTVISVAVFAFAWVSFHRAEFQFAENV